jgi:hypothetical protein
MDCFIIGMRAAIINRDWNLLLECLFDDKENPYYKACLSKDLEKAKECIKNGFYVEKSHRWVEPCIEHECGLSGCICDGYWKALYTFAWAYAPRNVDFYDNVFKFGLIRKNDLNEEIIKKMLVVSNNYQTDKWFSSFTQLLID